MIGDQERGAGVTTQQLIQFAQFTTLTFPADPAALSFVPYAPAVQQKEARTGVGRSMSQVERGDPQGGGGEQDRVGRGCLLVRVHMVRQQREVEIVVHIGQIMNFQAFDMLLKCRLIGQQRGHDHHGGVLHWHAATQFKPRQWRGAHGFRHETVDDRDRHIRRWHRAQTCEQGDHPSAGHPPAGHPPVRHLIDDANQPKREDDDANQQDHAGVSGDAAIGDPTHKPLPPWDAAVQTLSEGAAPSADQVIAGIAVMTRRRVPPCRGRDRLFGDVDFIMSGTTREFLDSAAIQVTGREIHGGEITTCAQRRIDEADALEPFSPVDGGNEPHTGDDVAHGDIGRALTLDLISHDLIGGGAFMRESFVQPTQHRRRVGISIAESLCQSHGEGGGPPGSVQIARDPGSAITYVRGQAPIRQRIGLLARVEARDNVLRQAAQILNQRDTKRDRDGPEFTDRQRLDTLICHHQAGEFLHVERAVGVGDQSPGDTEDARIAGEWAIGKLGEQAIETGRQIVFDLAYLCVHDMEVVEQPFRGRRDRLMRARRFDHRAIRGGQNARVVVEPWRELPTGTGLAGDTLRGRETFRVLLQPFDAEQFRADGRFR